LGDDPNFATTIATQIGNKVDKIEGKNLSTNDYTTKEKEKLAGLMVTNPNLLHNWCFMHPVNQRGCTVWDSASGTDTTTEKYNFTDGYTIDRWKLYENAGRMTATTSGIVISSTNGEMRLR
jgi:hypothetical protein